ncbi:MAG: ATP synthase F1 subunit delta [Oscillospiraceae bacterium]|nr:ATP synthase F1 subunit delta [Oscillospiraceae bacterium]
MKSVENVYSTALLDLLSDEHGDNQAGYAQILSELAAVNGVFNTNPELAKLSLIPTISRGDKLRVIENIFGRSGMGVSRYTLNFLLVLCREGRLPRFGAVYREFMARYYEKFGIVPVTVTSAFVLNAKQREKLTEKMQSITGKKVQLTEKTDKSLIGGVVVSYSGVRLDGSVKNRLETMKREIADVVL